MCWSVRPWPFKFFSMPPTRLALNNQSVVLPPAPYMAARPFSEVLVVIFQHLLRAPRFRFHTRFQSLWPTLFISLAQLSLLRFVQRTSLPLFQRGSLPVSSVVFPALFPALFPARFLKFRYVENPAILCLPSSLFLSPQALLVGPFWLGDSRLRLLCCMFFPVFLHSGKVWT